MFEFSTKTKYLKWDNDVIGIIKNSNSVIFKEPAYNQVVAMYTQGRTKWPQELYFDFLAERTISSGRRDIGKLLFRLGLSHYDITQITEITRGIHPKDLLWIANSKNERLSDTMSDVFFSVFHRRIDRTGNSIDSPEGLNIKRYGVHKGCYGIYKQRINPLTTDAESEIAVSLLGKALGVPVCPASRIDDDTIFSEFLFNYSREYIVQFRRLLHDTRSDNEYGNLLSIRPQYRDDFARMILLDFITRQDDRHLSNIAVKISNKEESFYPLFDNGRSLFYEDTEKTVIEAVNNPEGYATNFGYSGTYWDYIQKLAKEGRGLKGLINLDIKRTEIKSILTEAGFTGYRYTGALQWIEKTMDMIRDI